MEVATPPEAMVNDKCPTCGQRMHRIKVTALTCPVCSKVVPWSGRGARPKTHPECRGTWAKMREAKREETET